MEADNDKCHFSCFYHRYDPGLYKPDKNHYFLSSFFEIVLRVGDVSGADMLALPLVFSLGMIINAILLFLLFQKEFGDVWCFARKTFLKFWEHLC